VCVQYVVYHIRFDLFGEKRENGGLGRNCRFIITSGQTKGRITAAHDGSITFARLRQYAPYRHSHRTASEAL